MKRLCTLLLAAVLCGRAYAQEQAAPEISIIPQPTNVVQHTGRFVLPKLITVAAPNTKDIETTTAFLKEKLSTATGYTVKVVNQSAAPTVQLTLAKNNDAVIGDEGYYLYVKEKSVQIVANKPAGLFYGAQTLMQLFPPDIENKTALAGARWTAPCVSITDHPRFGWRGLMLDVSRHFFTKEEVKDYIDQMARYKFNLFHWHLTDDEGWRIEIKSRPELTTKGAFNVQRVGKFGTFKPISPDEPRTYGGFYTQEDIREVVDYAAKRFVNILPEVDVPGHSMAAVSAYPEISCTPDAANYQVHSGAAGFMNWTKEGIIATYDNTLCPANENAYKFLDDVFGEMSKLFPFGYIHVGGDECAKNYWEKSSEIKALMKKENLKTMEEVQSYFEKRVVKIIESKGKKVIGWDEILEGGLAPGAAVMSWRGEKGGVEASKLKHDVVMSPTTYVYLDYMQSDSIMEPNVYASLFLNKTYQFEPVPAGADAQFIKGGQANLWTEQIYNIRQVQYMTWPRAFAVAESVWSPKEKKEWSGFVKRVENHFIRFDREQVKYAPSMYDVIFTPAMKGADTLSIALETQIPDLDIYYSFDNSYPDQFYPKYTTPLLVPVDATQIKVITYRGDKPVGRMISMPVSTLTGRAKSKK
ncbi:MAG: family 20 glycosylhydrolase [Mucilaginibacter polytrichastri]|nr:family 20 glycosylhydrolase [Mucilaginibacter polytrichastri]